MPQSMEAPVKTRIERISRRLRPMRRAIQPEAGSMMAFSGESLGAKTTVSPWLMAFGGAGIVCGILSVKILALCHITSSNDMVQLLFGGDTFRPFLSGGDIGVAIFQLAIVTGIAVLYPLKVARGITPLDAISRD